MRTRIKSPMEEVIDSFLKLHQEEVKKVMGSDVYFLSPCCMTERYEEVLEDYRKCTHCGHIFEASELVIRTMDYKDEE